MEKIYSNLKRGSEKRGEVEFQAEIPLEALKKYEGRALAHAARDFEMPGFRKGKVPEHIVRQQIDEMGLLEEAANDALHDVVREIIADNHLSIVGSPRLTITKIALKNPIAFKVMFALYPEIKLPDYKKLGSEITARKDPAAEVTEADMDEAINRLLAMVALQNPELDTDKHKKPELTDAMVAKLGPFKTVDEFKARLKENLGQDKALQAKEMRREEIMRTIVEKSKVEIPELLLDEEWYAFEEKRNAQLAEAKIALEDYLKQAKKTEQELEKEERALIALRIKTSMVFREIQKVEAIEPSEKEIQTNIAYLKLNYPDRGEDWLRQTSEAVLIQEKIFELFG